MEQCQILKEYAQYVHCVRKYAKELELSEAVRRAVDECIQKGILSAFLRANKAEVISMSIFEYDKEEEERKLRKAEYEAGVADGFANGTKTAAIALAARKMDYAEIAEILNTTIEEIQQWVSK